MEFDNLSNRVIGCASEVHRYPGLAKFRMIALQSMRWVSGLNEPHGSAQRPGCKLPGGTTVQQGEGSIRPVDPAVVLICKQGKCL